MRRDASCPIIRRFIGRFDIRVAGLRPEMASVAGGGATSLKRKIRLRLECKSQ
jgi:hypothetical protein